MLRKTRTAHLPHNRRRDTPIRRAGCAAGFLLLRRQSGYGRPALYRIGNGPCDQRRERHLRFTGAADLARVTSFVSTQELRGTGEPLVAPECERLAQRLPLHARGRCRAHQPHALVACLDRPHVTERMVARVHGLQDTSGRGVLGLRVTALGL